MKYLKLHKMIWFILVTLFTLFDIFYVFILSLLSFIWNLNTFPFGRYWEECHTFEEIEYSPNYDEFWEHRIVEWHDDNPKETFVRRLHFWDNI